MQNAPCIKGGQRERPICFCMHEIFLDYKSNWSERWPLEGGTCVTEGPEWEVRLCLLVPLNRLPCAHTTWSVTTQLRLILKSGARLTRGDGLGT